MLESYVTKKRDKSAALAFMKRALKRHGKVEKIVTDGLKSYPAAMRDLGHPGRREMGCWLNNRAENSHLPFRRRERAMLRFRQMKSLQKFVSIHAAAYNHFGQGSRRRRYRFHLAGLAPPRMVCICSDNACLGRPLPCPVARVASQKH